MESNKLKMVLAGIAGTLLVLLIKGLLPNIPDSVITWAIGAVGGVPALGATGQALADGMTQGLTSSKSAQIIAGNQALADTKLATVQAQSNAPQVLSAPGAVTTTTTVQGV
jgi:hypothetical protein